VASAPERRTGARMVPRPGKDSRAGNLNVYGINRDKPGTDGTFSDMGIFVCLRFSATPFVALLPLGGMRAGHQPQPVQKRRRPGTPALRQRGRDIYFPHCRRLARIPASERRAQRRNERDAAWESHLFAKIKGAKRWPICLCRKDQENQELGAPGTRLCQEDQETRTWGTRSTERSGRVQAPAPRWLLQKFQR
jgi:hypothetical protein